MNEERAGCHSWKSAAKPLLLCNILLCGSLEARIPAALGWACRDSVRREVRNAGIPRADHKGAVSQDLLFTEEGDKQISPGPEQNKLLWQFGLSVPTIRRVKATLSQKINWKDKRNSASSYEEQVINLCFRVFCPVWIQIQIYKKIEKISRKRIGSYSTRTPTYFGFCNHHTYYIYIMRILKNLEN